MPFFYNAATSHDPAIRLASMINLATPCAVRAVASLGVAEQMAAGVHEVAYPVVHGRSFWDVLDVEANWRFLDELMLVQSEMTSPQVAELYDWSAVTEVVDVGGGSGGLACRDSSSW
ncbi:MAG: methyltransferase [Jatrophihabitantaceae bacterium]